MNRFNHFRMFLVTCLLLLAGTATAAAEMRSRSFVTEAPAAVGLRGDAAPSQVVTIAPSRKQLDDAAAAERTLRTPGGFDEALLPQDRPQQPTRVAAVFASQSELGVRTWRASVGAAGVEGYITQIEVNSLGAAGIRAEILLPASLRDGEVRVVAAPGMAAESIPLRSAYQGSLWTPYTEGERQIIEIFTPAAPGDVAIGIGRIGHFEQSLLTAAKLPPVAAMLTGLGGAGSCTRDAACSTGDSALNTAIQERKRSVAVMTFASGASFYNCTGTLLNSDAFPAPYFITANHCISTAAEAASLQTLWFFDAPGCGSGGAAPGQALNSTGAQLVFTNQFVDSTLLRLNTAPPSGTVFSGWNADPLTSGTAITSISHPQGDVTKWATGAVSATDNGYANITGFSQWMQRIRFSQGIIEGGSSGSGLFTLSGNSLQLRGILTGTTLQNSPGGLSCTNLNEDAVYGRFELFYPQIATFLRDPPVADDDYPNQPSLTGPELPLNSQLDATIEREGDLDVFRIVIPADGFLTVGSYGEYDMIGGLFQSSGACLKSGAHCDSTAVNDDANPGIDTNFGIARTLTAGTYFLVVGTWDNKPTPNGYRVYANFTATDAVRPALSKRGGIDIDGSGRSQLVVRSITGQMKVGRYANKVFQFTSQDDPGASVRILGAADLDGNGKSDLLFQNITQGDVGDVWAWRDFNSANAQYLRTVKRTWDVQALADMDGDGLADMVWRYVVTESPDTGVSYVWFTDRNQVTPPQVKKRGGAPLTWTLVGAADLNYDGAGDMIYASPTGQLRVLMAIGNRACANLLAGSIPTDFTALKLADFTGARRGDILIRHKTTGEVRLMVLNANGLELPTLGTTDANGACTASTAVVSTSLVPVATADPTWQLYATGDFDGDGIFDIVWRRPDGTLTLWLMEGLGAPTVINNAGSAPVGFTPIPIQ